MVFDLCLESDVWLVCFLVLVCVSDLLSFLLLVFVCFLFIDKYKNLNQNQKTNKPNITFQKQSKKQKKQHKNKSQATMSEYNVWTSWLLRFGFVATTTARVVVNSWLCRDLLTGTKCHTTSAKHDEL